MKNGPTVPKQQNHHLLIRACQNRCLWQRPELLYEYLAQHLVEGTYGLRVHGDTRTGRKSRDAFLAVRFMPVEIQRPASLAAADYPPHLRIYAIEVREVQPPKDQEPILWRLLTTHEVLSFEKALQIIQWYCWRWRIEQLFATLKLAGLDIESTQLESPDAIKKLTVLALSVAVRTLQMFASLPTCVYTVAFGRGARGEGLGSFHVTLVINSDSSKCDHTSMNCY